MSMYEGFLPTTQIPGKIGYYPVSSAEEWEALPNVYKAMDWFPVKMKNRGFEETTFVEYVEFDVTYALPYKVSGTFRVHRQEVQKILFCLFKNPEVHLYTISGVVFQNGERWGAKWYQDSWTGAYEVVASGKIVGRQGGFLGFVPSRIERTEDGGWKYNWKNCENICHYELSNPFQ